MAPLGHNELIEQISETGDRELTTFLNRMMLSTSRTGERKTISLSVTEIQAVGYTNIFL